MFRIRKEFRCRRAFDNHTVLHDDNPVRHFPRQPQVMGYKKNAPARFSADFTKQPHNLPLRIYIQRRRRLITDEQFRIAGKGNGDGNPLAHPAGKMMRILMKTNFCVFNSHTGKQRNCPRLCLSFAESVP